MINSKKIIFKPYNYCKICFTPVWYNFKQSYKRDSKSYITCPTYNNEIQIT